MKIVEFFVLVNGELVGFFNAERGLRQRDPLFVFFAYIGIGRF